MSRRLVQYVSDAPNVAGAGSRKLLAEAMICMTPLRSEYDTEIRSMYKTADGAVRQEITRCVQKSLLDLFHDPPSQHTADGHPAGLVLEIQGQLDAGGQATVATVQRKVSAGDTHSSLLFKDDPRNPPQVLKVYFVGNQHHKQFHAQEMALAFMELGPNVLQASEIGIVWLRSETDPSARPALALLMPQLSHTVADDIEEWCRPGAQLPSTLDQLSTAFEVLMGVCSLHKHGIIHRDIKPENVGYLNGRLVLFDLGLARLGPLNMFGLPQHSQEVGTFTRMPPEMILALLISRIERHLKFLSRSIPDALSNGENNFADFMQRQQEDYKRGLDVLQHPGPDFASKADVYSFGLLMLQLLTNGLPPFHMLVSQAHIESPTGRQLQDILDDNWIAVGPKWLLKVTYCKQPGFSEKLAELDGLQDCLEQALAPPWRRPGAAELAAHRVFDALGAHLLRRIEMSSSLHEKECHAEILRIWSSYQPEAAQELCKNPRAAFIFSAADNLQVKQTAMQALAKVQLPWSKLESKLPEVPAPPPATNRIDFRKLLGMIKAGPSPCVDVATSLTSEPSELGEVYRKAAAAKAGPSDQKIVDKPGESSSSIQDDVELRVLSMAYNTAAGESKDYMTCSGGSISTASTVYQSVQQSVRMSAAEEADTGSSGLRRSARLAEKHRARTGNGEVPSTVLNAGDGRVRALSRCSGPAQSEGAAVRSTEGGYPARKGNSSKKGG